MLTEFLVEDKTYIARAREVFIRMSLLVITGVSCFVILRPFLDMIIAGIIIAIGLYPAYKKLTHALRGRDTLAAVLCTVVLLAVILVPMLLLAETLVAGIRNVADQLMGGQLRIPAPPPSLEKLPVVGGKLTEFWNSFSGDISAAMGRLAPQIQKYIPALVATTVGVGGVVLRFMVAILLAGFLLATSEQRVRFADKLFARIFDDQGPDFEQLVASTIRTVTNGVLGVAVIQSVLASLGFWIVGLPGAGLWAVMFLIAAVIQVGALVLLPAVLYAFASFPTSHAVIFLIWCAFVGVIDNVLKPILLGRSSKVPMLVVFVGVLGGFMVMRIIGLFVGAIILSVGYKLLIAWLDAGIPSTDRASTSTTVAA
jgi:predicted PurR-regulated permease PerM